ncbi:BTAD domain-containing putative transcriptional regulator [Actinomycetospora cinnamomea]|uniref:Putative ATPase n=1 Tax=Actinomycetospora cinnamomea TaxID=663609 RepID=A0A2U1FRL9_9PSEU|nr:BTAD domain-containing putative transcriptional regulator [Actinomycetospora cinnamomea]PVZ14817.1 putative ATPase [Actinomycetospora cinnamomea]
MADRQDPDPVAFGVLGPLEVTVAGRAVPLGGPRARGVLAMLLLARGAAVSEDALVDVVWGDAPPRGARNSLQSHVSRLRTSLAAAGACATGDRLRREPGGYRLRVAATEFDVPRVEALLARARAVREDAPARAVVLLDQARSCWRGPALADLADLPGWQLSGLAAERARLDQLESSVCEELLEARVRAGGHLAALPELERAAHSSPTHEAPHRLLALALYRSGRQADALDVLRRYRDRLADQAGLDPSPEFAALHQAILGHDPALAPRPETVAPVGPVLQEVPSSSFVGRADDVARLAAAVRDARLVTVTGPGGVGKTRLVLEALPQVAAGLDPLVLELASVRRGAAVVPALAAALGVREGSGATLAEAVLAHLGTRRLLLVIDNCEHLATEVVTLVDAVVARAPTVRVVTTSRRRLGVVGEQVLPLEPLSQASAVQLFTDRARRARESFPADGSALPLVEELCHRLDRLPLAVELAAAQVGALGLADLRDRLDDRLDLLVALDGDRHATLRAVVDWSYRLLSEEGRRTFEAVSVFDAGFPLDAAEHVAGDASGGAVACHLARLVDASLVAATPEGGERLRYHLLETLRTYGRERLAARGARPAVLARHAMWVDRLVAAAEQGLDGPDEAAWVRRLDAHLPDIRSAWHRLHEAGDVDGAARLSVALAGYAQWQGRSELWGWARRLAEGEVPDPELRVAVHGAAAQAAYLQGDLSASARYAESGLAGAPGAPRRWWCLAARHILAMYRGSYAEAERLAGLLQADEGVSPTWRVVLLGNIALARTYRGDTDAARAAVEPCRRAAAALAGPTGLAWSRYVDGEVALPTDPVRAARSLGEAVTIARGVDATFVEGVATVGLVSAAMRSGDTRRAMDGFPEAIRHWARTGMRVQQWTTLRILVELLVGLEVHVPAAVLITAADAAPDAPAVVGADAQRLDALRETLRERLGDEAMERAGARSSGLTTPDVIAYALDHALPAAAGALVRGP